MAIQAFNTGKFTEKVLALSTYDSLILENLYINPINKQKINRGAAFLIKNYFNTYMDMRARQTPTAYHHVYEFNKVGDPSSRLFSANINSTPDGTAMITYSFTQAKEPNKDGYPFPEKASVMESGETITITPKQGKYLKYQLKDGTFVTSEKSIVENPGGPEVAGSFEKTFSWFMANQANVVLQKFRFFNKIEDAMIIKRKLMIPRINSGIVTDAATKAKIDADSITNGVMSLYA